MRFFIPIFRVTSEAMPDADKKLKRALEPLLDTLNIVINQMVATLNGMVMPSLKTTSFTTSAGGTAYVDLGLGAPAQEVWVSGLANKDGSVVASVWTMSWTPLGSGARLLFLGLAAAATYNLKVRYV